MYSWFSIVFFSSLIIKSLIRRITRQYTKNALTFTLYSFSKGERFTNSQVLRIHLFENSVWNVFKIIEIVWDHKSDSTQRRNKFTTKVCVQSPCIVWFPSKRLTKIQKWMNTLLAFSLFGWVVVYPILLLVIYMNSHMPHAVTPTPFLTTFGGFREKLLYMAHSVGILLVRIRF